jgi:ParB family chromosome partitioning protein
MNTQIIAVENITIPEWCERPFVKNADDRDRSSIEKNGIQQPLVVLEADGGLVLVKGLRRLRIAKALGLGKVPVITTPVPEGASVDDYGRELRLSLDVHRSDLLPSQKATVIETLKARFGMNNKQVAAFLHCDADTCTNVLAIRRYIPPVVAAIDAG